jgi:hypothetical protein
LWQEHLPKIEALGSVKMFEADEIPALELIWENDGATLDLIYFYCHGGVEESSKQPYLALSGERIYSNFWKTLSIGGSITRWSYSTGVAQVITGQKATSA